MPNMQQGSCQGKSYHEVSRELLPHIESRRPIYWRLFVPDRTATRGPATLSSSLQHPPLLFVGTTSGHRPSSRRLCSIFVSLYLGDRLLCPPDDAVGRLRDQDPCFRAVVFSQFTSFLDLIQKVLEREGLPWYRFDGSMDIKKRNEAVTVFKAPSREPKVLIISLKAGGVGLNVGSFLHHTSFTLIIIHDS